MTIEVKRSPAKVCWWLLVNGVIYDTFERKYLAEAECDALKRRYGV